MSILMDGSVQMADLMSFQCDPDASVLDPQLSMGYFNNLSGKDASENLTIDPSSWQLPPNTSERFDLVQPHGYQPEEDNVDDDSLDGPTHNTRARASKTGRTSSKSSVPSLSSGSTGSPASPGKQTQARSNTTRKKNAKGPARKKQKTAKNMDVSDGDDGDDDEDDSKRNKYLERNRVAASKCRQKKKVWVNDLEATKNEMEHKHAKLQRDVTGLVQEVTELKNQLMSHSGCGDVRIDAWINQEAKRFVATRLEQQQHEQATRRISIEDGSFAGRRRPSSTESLIQQQPSPTVSNGTFPQSPIIKEEMTDMNYDHMPDNMFQ